MSKSEGRYKKMGQVFPFEKLDLPFFQNDKRKNEGMYYKQFNSAGFLTPGLFIR